MDYIDGHYRTICTPTAIKHSEARLSAEVGVPIAAVSATYVAATTLDITRPIPGVGATDASVGTVATDAVASAGVVWIAIWSRVNWGSKGTHDEGSQRDRHNKEVLHLLSKD